MGTVMCLSFSVIITVDHKLTSKWTGTLVPCSTFSLLNAHTHINSQKNNHSLVVWGTHSIH